MRSRFKCGVLHTYQNGVWRFVTAGSGLSAGIPGFSWVNDTNVNESFQPLLPSRSRQDSLRLSLQFFDSALLLALVPIF